MTQFSTPGLGIQAGWLSKEGGWKAGMDRNLVVLGAIARGIVEAVDIVELPADPQIGQAWLIAVSPEAWLSPELNGQDGNVLVKAEDGWYFVSPSVGMSFTEPSLVTIFVFSGFEWLPTGSPISGNYVAIIDMAGGDYVMAKHEAEAAVKVIINGQAGSTLTWPASAADTAPVSQLVISIFCEDGINLVLEGAGASATTLLAGPLAHIFFGKDLGIYLIDNKVKSGRSVVADYVVSKLDCGSVLYVNSATPVTLEIPFNDVCDSGFNFQVVQEGAGEVVFAGQVEVSLFNPEGHSKTAGQGSTVDFLGLGDGKMTFRGQTAA